MYFTTHMKKMTSGRRNAPILISCLMAALLAGCGGSDHVNPPAPVVHVANQLYTETNETSNKIVHMTRGADGSLTVANTTTTGGSGSNGIALGSTTATPGADSLASQHSITLSSDGTVLFAVNAGSNSISTFSIDPATGNLTLLKASATTGNFPTSVAFNKGYLYVSFQGGSQQLQAYKVNADGSLQAVGGYSLSTNGSAADAPTQVIASPNGAFIVVNAGVASNEVIAFPTNADGTLGAPVTNTAGVTAPFAGAFVGNNAYLATDITDKALSSFSFANGTLVANGTPVINGIGAPCWLSITPDGRFAYVGNGAGPISSYAISASGALTLLNASAASDSTTVAGDSWISGDGKFLYTAYLANGIVIAYSIGSDGSLTKVGAPAMVPTATGVSMQGLVGI